MMSRTWFRLGGTSGTSSFCSNVAVSSPLLGSICFQLVIGRDCFEDFLFARAFFARKGYEAGCADDGRGAWESWKVGDAEHHTRLITILQLGREDKNRHRRKIYETFEPKSFVLRLSGSWRHQNVGIPLPLFNSPRVAFVNSQTEITFFSECSIKSSDSVKAMSVINWDGHSDADDMLSAIKSLGRKPLERARPLQRVMTSNARNVMNHSARSSCDRWVEFREFSICIRLRLVTEGFVLGVIRRLRHFLNWKYWKFWRTPGVRKFMAKTCRHLSEKFIFLLFHHPRTLRNLCSRA